MKKLKAEKFTSNVSLGVLNSRSASLLKNGFGISGLSFKDPAIVFTSVFAAGIRSGVVFALLFSSLVQAEPITITTPLVSSGDLIRAEDWNRIKVDLDSLSVGLDILTNQTWLPNGSDLYFNLGNVGIGTTSPAAPLTIFEQSPLPGALLIQAGTDTDNQRFTVEEDGDTSLDGNLLIRGGNMYDSDGNLSVSGEENLYLLADWDNDEADTASIIFGKNNAGPGTNFVELMRLTETGLLGLGTVTPFQTWSGLPNTGLELAGVGAQLGFSRVGGSRWVWEITDNGFELSNDATSVTPLTINSAGQVGISQVAPQRALHVGGTGRFDNAIETNLWCNQSGSGCISQLLVQSLLASGSGPQACPAGTTMVGGVGHSNTFCMDINERVATDYWGAKDICIGLSDSILGNARLCSAREWYEACSSGTGNAMTGNLEWVDELDTTPESLTVGETDCQSVSSDDLANNHVFRCCY